MWGKKKRPKLRKRSPPKPKPEPCSSRPAMRSRSAKSRKADDLLKLEETSIRFPNVDQFVGESGSEESPRKRRRTERIKVGDMTGFDSSPVWLHNPWAASGPDEPATPSGIASADPTEVQMSDVVLPQPPTVWYLPSPPTEMFDEDVESSPRVLTNDNLSSGPMLVDQETFVTPLSTEITVKPSASVKLPLTPPHTPDSAASSTFGRAVLSLSQSSVTRTATKRPSRVLESLLVLPASSASIFEARSHQDHLAVGRDPEEEFNGLLGPSLFPYSPPHAPGPNNEVATEEGPRDSPVPKASDDTRTETRSVSLKRVRDTELRTVSAPKATKLSPMRESSELLTRVTRSKKPPVAERKTTSKKKAAANCSDARPSREADQVAVAVRQSLREKKKRVRQW
ncbi:hypothetical protein BDZ89DRAFT_705563 [Hymenopellis radicata]|nr:hypothetical protein BDZ89DRAFT_705563 [Hymenopellis radicata]